MWRTPKNEPEVTEWRIQMYERIEHALTSAGLPTEQEKIGKMVVPPVTQGAVSQWKNGQTTPNVDHVTVIAFKTGFNFEWLWTGRGPERPELSPQSPEEVLTLLLDSLPDADRARIIDRSQKKKRG